MEEEAPVSLAEITSLVRVIDVVSAHTKNSVVVKLPLIACSPNVLGFFYQFCRAMTLRLNGGMLERNKMESEGSNEPCLVIVCDAHVEVEVNKCPFITCLVQDNYLQINTANSNKISPNAMVITVSIRDDLQDKDGLNSQTCCLSIVLRSKSETETTVTSAISSTRISKHKYKNGSAFTITPADSYEIPELIKQGFYSCMETNFGLGDIDVLKHLTPKQSDKCFHKLVMERTRSPSNQEEFVGDSALAASEKKNGISTDNIRVWTAPSSAGAVQYSMAILRLCSMRPDVLEAVLPLLMEKVVYLRNTSANLRAEVVEVVQLCLTMHIPDQSNCFLFDKAVRFLMQLNAETAGLRMSELAVRVCGDDHLLAQVILGRCLEALGHTKHLRALEVFRFILNLDPKHQEALLAVKRLESKISHKSHPANQIETVMDTQVVPIKAITMEERGAEQHEDVPLKATTGWARMVAKAQQRALENAGYKCLQRDARVSQSVMYELMRDFYNQRGLDAWGSGEERRTDIVPFYITSNPKIAAGYVQVLLGAIHDMFEQGKLDQSSPVYVIELGTGPGKFSSLFLNELSVQLETLSETQGSKNMAGLSNVVYVMSDFTESNLSAWRSDEALKPHVESGLCDFALFNCDDDDTSIEDTSIHLINSGVVISKAKPVKNPIVLFSNYLFDSIKMDAFRVKQGKLFEALLSTFSKIPCNIEGGPFKEGNDEHIDVSIAGNIKHEWAYPLVPNPASYYGNDVDIDDVDDDVNLGALDQEMNKRGGCGQRMKSTRAFSLALCKVLESYCKDLTDDSCFSIPLSGLKLFDTFVNLSSSRSLCMVIADKGHNRPHMLNRKSNPLISLHGSLSMMVNFDAIGRFLREYCSQLVVSPLNQRQKTKYSIVHTPQQNSDLDLCLVTLGFESKRSKSEFVDNFCMFGVFDLFTLRDHIEDVIFSQSLPEVQSTSSVPIIGVDDDGSTKEAKEAPKQLSTTYTPPPPPSQHSSSPSLESTPLPVIVSLLRLSCWDPDLLAQFGDSILDSLRNTKTSIQIQKETNTAGDREMTYWIAVLKSNMHKLQGNLNPRFDGDGSVQRVYEAISEQLENM